MMCLDLPLSAAVTGGKSLLLIPEKGGNSGKFRSLLKRNWAADSGKCLLSPAGRETRRETSRKLRANRISGL